MDKKTYLQTTMSSNVLPLLLETMTTWLKKEGLSSDEITSVSIVYSYFEHMWVGKIAWIYKDN